MLRHLKQTTMTASSSDYKNFSKAYITHTYTCTHMKLCTHACMHIYRQEIKNKRGGWLGRGVEKWYQVWSPWSKPTHMKNHLILLWPYCHHWLPVHYSVKGEKEIGLKWRKMRMPFFDRYSVGRYIYIFLHRLLKCCLTSSETVRLLGMGNSGQPPQLSPSLWALYIFQCSTPIYTCWYLKYYPVNLKLGPSAEKWGSVCWFVPFHPWGWWEESLML